MNLSFKTLNVILLYLMLVEAEELSLFRNSNTEKLL